MRNMTSRRLLGVLTTLALAVWLLPLTSPPARGADPVVTLVGSLQSEAGCAGDWDPGCTTSDMEQKQPGVWTKTVTLPAGSYEYKVALNHSWDINYGAGAVQGGANIALNLTAPTIVTFVYSDATHLIADDFTTPLTLVAGSFQSELGCSGDWQPDCLAAWLADPAGGSVLRFSTTALPVGSFEAKVTVGRTWDTNYGAGGVPGGANIPFEVTKAGQTVEFSFDTATHVLTITVVGADPAIDGDVWWDGLKHDSRDNLYRTPSGTATAGTPVTLRFRTFHDDVTGVKLRLYSLNEGGAKALPMTKAAAGVSCYEESLATSTCDLWEYTIPGTHAADNLWYRFIVADGTDTVYYADNTAALDGGLGSASDDQIDQSWALMLSVPNFAAPSWAKDAIVYQIFPDRFRSGRSSDDPDTGDLRYDDPVLSLDWGTDPEGYCRNYAGATSATCPWRWDEPVEGTTSEVEQPRGRDYFGGDLKGVDQQLAYLKSIGINTIYLNPIFDAGSNHAYDTQDYRKVDPGFGTSKDFDNLVKHARQLGIRLVLDGVFNHMSSDSPFFDRYDRYPTVGACESVTSPWRSWFTFTPDAEGPCAGPGGPGTMNYTGWFGFDSIPVLTKTNAEVQQYFLTAPDAIAKLWLKAGAAGWRLDVSGDASFPTGYWESFRTVTKQVKPDSLSISETWQKDSTLLRSLRGDRLDSTMNYRLRDAVLGLLAPQSFDSKGFADSGRQITASEFVNRLASVREDYPDAAYYSLMNLLDSHDTERLLWTLTDGANNASRDVPGDDDTARLRMAALIQFTQAGMPTVYYGDEVGMTGADDPDDRRTYPWSDLGGQPDTALRAWYGGLAKARTADAALTTGDFRALLADDAADTVAYGRGTPTGAAVVALNTSDTDRELSIPVAGFLPDGVSLSFRYGAGLSSLASATVTDGAVEISLPAMTGAYLSTGTTDLAGPAKSTLTVTAESSNQVSLSWTGVPGAVSYNLYVSPVSGGGWVKSNETPITGTTATVTGLTNTVSYHLVVRGVDAVGNEGASSSEVVAVPHLEIGWANLQWPPAMTHTISAIDRTDNAYGQVWIDGATNLSGATVGLRAQLGFGPTDTTPTSDAWQWVDAAFNGDAGNNDEFVASLLPGEIGSFDYLFRYSVTAGRDWLYADLSGPISGASGNPGRLTVEASGDTTAPASPTGFHVVSGSPGAIELAWDPVAGDASLFGYEIGRRPSGSGDFVLLGHVTDAAYVDTSVTEGASYDYVVRSVDLSLNRSPWTTPVTGEAALRVVTLSFIVTVPATTDGTGLGVRIAGSLDRLDGGLPAWDPGGVSLTRVDATHWTWTATGKEGTQIEYKYTLGDWDHVEKDGACGEIGNRQLTLTYGSTGTQTITDTVENWRNVAPCGN